MYYNDVPTAEELIFGKKTIWLNEISRMKSFLELAEQAQTLTSNSHCTESDLKNTRSQIEKLYNCELLGYFIFSKNGCKDYCERSCDRKYEQAYLSQLVRLLENEYFLAMINREVKYHPVHFHDPSEEDWGTNECMCFVEQIDNEYSQTNDLCMWLLVDLSRSKDFIDTPVDGDENKFTSWTNLTKLNLRTCYRLIMLGLPDQQDGSFAKKFHDKYTNLLMRAERYNESGWGDELRSKYIKILGQAFEAISTTMAPHLIDSDSLNGKICSCLKHRRQLKRFYLSFLRRKSGYLTRFSRECQDFDFLNEFVSPICSPDEKRQYQSYLVSLKSQLERDYENFLATL